MNAHLVQKPASVNRVSSAYDDYTLWSGERLSSTSEL